MRFPFEIGDSETDQPLSYESGTMELMEQSLLGLKSSLYIYIYIFGIKNLEKNLGQKNPINKSPPGCFDYRKTLIEVPPFSLVDDLREFPISLSNGIGQSGTFTPYRSAV